MQEYKNALENDLCRAVARARVQRPVGSPCINVCRMSAQSGYCEGCFRTIDEIRAWKGLDDAGRLALLACLVDRQSDLLVGDRGAPTRLNEDSQDKPG